MTIPAARKTAGFMHATPDAKQSALSRMELFAAEAARAKASDLAFAAASTLKKAIQAYHKADWREAALNAASAADLDPDSGTAYHLLALALDNLGQMSAAADMYQKALRLQPDDPDIYLNVGLAAWKMNMLEQAERAFRLYIEARPHCPKGYTNLGGCLRDMGRFDDAIDLVRDAIYLIPQAELLWNTLGTICGENSDFENAVTFYKEAIRINPETDRFWHNLAYALTHMGPLDEAMASYNRALELNTTHEGSATDRLEMIHARGLCGASIGALDQAWTDYETRLDPAYGNAVLISVKPPAWRGEDLGGKRVLIVGEQGIGDEIMFAETVPDLIEACGPDGKVMIACDHRLVPIFQRSFPQAFVAPQYNAKKGAKTIRIAPWADGPYACDVHLAAGTALKYLRTTTEMFGKHGSYLKADPDRTEFWRRKLSSIGSELKVGICWRSGFLNVQRRKHYAAIEDWAKALNVPGVRLINLQYGDCRDELARARALTGGDIVAFEDLDLKDDLNEAAALSAALDLVISAPTATAAMAAALGTETWFVLPGRSWPQLGTDRYPWYPRTKVITAPGFGDWPTILNGMSDAIRTRTNEPPL